MRRDICTTDQLSHRWRFAQSDARYRLSAASVHRHHEFAIPAVAFVPVFYSELGSDLCCG